MTKQTPTPLKKRKDAPHQIPVHECELDNKLKFHASIKAPKQWKKRDKTARYLYNLIVCLWIDLYEQDLYHPKTTKESLTKPEMETIVHNIGRLAADEITSLNKFNLTNEIPKIMEHATKYTTDKIKKSVSKSKKILPKK